MTISASISWKPSGRTPVTRSDSVTFAGASSVVTAPPSASRPHAATSSSSARAVGADPGSREARRVRRARRGSGAASSGAARSRRARGRRAAPGRRRRRAVGAAPDADEHRLDLRAGQEHAGTDAADQLGGGVVRDLHRRDAVGGVAHRRRQPLARLPLHHHEQFARRPARRRARRARAGSRRCRAGWRRASHGSSGGSRTSAHSSVVASPSTSRTPGARSDSTCRRTGSTCRSISTAVTDAPVSARATVRDPSPAPISTTWSPGPDAGEPGDAADRPGLDDEVLPERARRRKPVACRAERKPRRG